MKMCFPHNFFFFCTTGKYARITRGIHKHPCQTSAVELIFINTDQPEARKDKVSDFMMNTFSIFTFLILSL